MDKETRRLRPSDVEKDQDSFDALQAIEGYAPSREGLSVEELEAQNQDLRNKRKIEVQKEKEYKAARDIATVAEHAFHDAMLEVKNQVRAQFGDSSNELQSIGLKKKSEYKKKSQKKTEQ